MTLKLTVDRDLCLSSGLCTGIAPDVLELDESGVLVVLDQHPGPESAEDVEEAVRACPVRALILVED
jgi:ferredoxin